MSRDRVVKPCGRRMRFTRSGDPAPNCLKHVLRIACEKHGLEFRHSPVMPIHVEQRED
ncbi:MAG: hypothetical protein ACOVKS_00985 [Aquimonas sp.]